MGESVLNHQCKISQIISGIANLTLRFFDVTGCKTSLDDIVIEKKKLEMTLNIHNINDTDVARLCVLLFLCNVGKFLEIFSKF